MRNERTAPAAIRLPDCGATTCERPQKLSILGATGSIGESTLDLVARQPEAFQIIALSAQSNVEKLAALALAHKAEIAVIADPAHYGSLKERLAGSGIEAAAGDAAMLEAAARPTDCVMAAIVGAAGLKPTFAAARSARRVALANKECLVSAGAVFLAEIAEAGCELLPVDSEHSAALQALAGAPAGSVERIVLTASGGPFRTWELDRLASVTPEQALRHPNWSMGAKITIDSATLMNKGLELIEAYHLFPVMPDQLDAVIHPQSIVHCLVHFVDGSVIAQLANPDMRTPISYALAWPQRRSAPTARLDLVAAGNLSFEAIDIERFPAFSIAKSALQKGGAAPAILNAANEIAVEAFLDRKLRFLDIPTVVCDALAAADAAQCLGPLASLDGVLAADAEGRRLAREALRFRGA